MTSHRYPTVGDTPPGISASLDHTRARELSFRVLVQLIEAGDRQALINLGLDAETITALEGLTLGQLHYLARFGGHFLHLRIDTQRLAHALNRVLDQQGTDQLQEALLRHQAPASMMRALFGMGKREFIRRRRPLGLPPAGRPRSPTVEESELLSRGWRETEGKPPAERYLHLAEVSQLPLTVIWAARDDFQVPLNPIDIRAREED